MRTWKFKALDKPFFNSRVKSDEVKNSERWLGFFAGPALVATVYAGVGGSYLNSFYTDVLHLSAFAGGMFLSLMPVISKILDAITNIIMGRIVDNTKSRQGKARPWILVSGPLMAIASILMFAVPKSNMLITAVWVTFSYNLYFCISYTMYNLSNVLTLPLSTRDSKKRDTLAMAQSMGINMIPGVILAVLFPAIVLPYMGVDQDRWIFMMSTLSILCLFGTLLQYYFTRERVTEEVKADPLTGDKTVSLSQQIRGCLSSKYWVMIMIVMLAYYISNAVGVNGMLYYANWVVGTYNDGTTLTMLNIIGQAMLGPGIILIWPMVKKIGKRKTFIILGVIAIIGGIVGVLKATTLSAALIALTIRSIGQLPITYVTLSVLADALDHVEWKCGYRCDGFSSSIYSIILTVTSGFGLGILNMGLSMAGYVAPNADGSWIAQNPAVQNWCTFATFGFPMISMIVVVIVFILFDLEKKLPQMQAEIKVRNAENNAEGVSIEE